MDDFGFGHQWHRRLRRCNLSKPVISDLHQPISVLGIDYNGVSFSVENQWKYMEGKSLVSCNNIDVCHIRSPQRCHTVIHLHPLCTDSHHQNVLHHVRNFRCYFCIRLLHQERSFQVGKFSFHGVRRTYHCIGGQHILQEQYARLHYQHSRRVTLCRFDHLGQPEYQASISSCTRHERDFTEDSTVWRT